ncbi:5-oxoprolinase subunit PxpB [Streptomyces sp. NPDC051994]|uniref:5-oxoprolinase subunit PxpB n=1 Tax=unclassified Streptomyces TaxID=2593676 RepID=UPI003419095A
MTADALRILPVGASALLIELDSGEAAEALHAELLRRRAAGALPPVREIVPAARTVLLDGVSDPVALGALVRTWDIPPLEAGARDTVEIAVRYDGPDLADVAALWQVSAQEAVRIHSSAEFRVAFCGFAPGFGYLTGLAERYAVPRRDTPRTSVPAGSVALAGPYTGVYPRSSPGGWQLIGTTDAALWDPHREPAALLTPGTRVRFVRQETP